MGRIGSLGLAGALALVLVACGGGGGGAAGGSGNTGGNGVIPSGPSGNGFNPGSSTPGPSASRPPGATPSPPAGATPPPPSATSTPAPIPTVTPTALPILTDTSMSTAGVFLGADCGQYAAVSCANFPSVFRHGVAMGTIYQTWDQDVTHVLTVNNVASWYAQGTIPNITWQPESNFSTVTLAGIVAGTYDSYITTSAQELKTFAQPVFIRMMHEFNTERYPWSLYQNGADSNADTEYIAAWQHIVNIFRAQGVTNVKFIWNFNSSTSPIASWNVPALAYPGDAYVDWISFDGYNMGNKYNGKNWSTFSGIVSGAYKQAQAATLNKPIMMVETASNEYGDGGTMKSQWIDAMMQALSSSPSPWPALHAVSWYEADQTYPFDSKSTQPVYTHFTNDIRTYAPGGLLNIRSNGNALWTITAP